MSSAFSFSGGDFSVKNVTFHKLKWVVFGILEDIKSNSTIHAVKDERIDDDEVLSRIHTRNCEIYRYQTKNLQDQETYVKVASTVDR